MTLDKSVSCVCENGENGDESVSVPHSAGPSMSNHGDTKVSSADHSWSANVCLFRCRLTVIGFRWRVMWKQIHKLHCVNVVAEMLYPSMHVGPKYAQSYRHIVANRRPSMSAMVRASFILPWTPL